MANDEDGQSAWSPPVVDADAVIALLRERFDGAIEPPEQLVGGQVAQTFSSAVGGVPVIVRFNRGLGANFAKEAFLAGLVGSAVPIPAILSHGRLQDLHFAVSERAQGTPVDHLPPAATTALVPALLDALDDIHAVDTTGTVGSGIIGDDGNGMFASWHDYLRDVRDPGPPGDFYDGWHGLFDTTFLDRASFDRLYERMVALLPFCPEARALVHGDFGFGNVLAEDSRITAVLDWINAKYGDPLYDVAWLDFWGKGMDYAVTYRRRWAGRGIDLPGFAERLRCYQAYIALDASRFFAKSGNEDFYRWAQTRAHELVFEGD